MMAKETTKKRLGIARRAIVGGFYRLYSVCGCVPPKEDERKGEDNDEGPAGGNNAGAVVSELWRN
jgi:hypothetical protein